MLETFSRTTSVPSRFEQVDFVPTNPEMMEHPELLTPAPRTFLWGGYNRTTEVLRTDNVGPNSEWKPCQHYYVGHGESTPAMGASNINDSFYASGHWTQQLKGQVKDPYAFYYGVYGEEGKLNYGLPSFYAPQPDGGFIPPPAKLDELNNRALAVMLPLIRSELSLINSVYELKDFVTLKHHVRGTIQEVRKASVWLLNAIRRNNGSLSRPLAALVRQTAGNYLQYKFNFSPLVSDIRGIYNALKTCERRVNDLVARSGRPQSRHFAFNWDEFENPEPELEQVYLHNQVPFISYYMNWRRFVTHRPTSFHAQIQYNFNYTAYQAEHARLLGLLDILGVNLNPRIIWNAIPWSFVADWVIGVGRFLDQFAIANMKPQINIHRYLWSVKRERTIQVTRRSTWFPDIYSDVTTDYTEVPLPTITETAYRRDVGMPSASSIISSGINSQEFTLGAALILSRRRRSRHR